LRLDLGMKFADLCCLKHSFIHCNVTGCVWANLAI